MLEETQLSEKQLKKEIFSGTVVAFIMKGLYAVSSFLLYIVISRKLGAEEAGYFFLTQTIIILSAFLVRQGFDSAIIKNVAGYHYHNDCNNIAGVYRLCLTRIVPVSLITVFILFFSSAWIAEFIFDKPNLNQVFRIGFLAIIPIAISQLHGFFFQGQKKIILAMTFDTVLLSFASAVSFYIFNPESASDGMVLYCVLSFVVGFGAILTWNFDRVPKLFKLDLNTRNEIQNTAKSLFVIIILLQTTQWVGQLILGVFGTPQEVAIFATAQRTAMLVSFVLISVNAIAAPKFAEAYKKGEYDEIRKVAKISSRIMFFVSVPVVSIMLLFSSWLMGLFGAEFDRGEVILRILVIGQFVNVLTGSVGYLLQMTGNEKIFRDSVFISSLIMIFGSVVFIPNFGIVGAAWVSTIAIATQNLLCVYQVKKKLGFNTLNIFSR